MNSFPSGNLIFSFFLPTAAQTSGRAVYEEEDLNGVGRKPGVKETAGKGYARAKFLLPAFLVVLD